MVFVCARISSLPRHIAESIVLNTFKSTMPPHLLPCKVCFAWSTYTYNINIYILTRWRTDEQAHSPEPNTQYFCWHCRVGGCLRNSQRRRRLCGSCRRFGILIRLDKCKLSEGWRTDTGPVTALCARFYPIDREIYWGVEKLDSSPWFDGKKKCQQISP